jgi:hypothetical protein
MKINIILLCILIFLILIYLNNNNTKTGSREGISTPNPLSYKLTDENITKIYKEYCNKFGLPGGLELNDARRQLSLTELINDAKSFVNDPNSVNLCYTTPPTPTTVLTDELRTKVYGIFCDKNVTLTNARKAMTFDQLWADASSLATGNSPDCFSTVLNPNGLSDAHITSIYSGYCDKFGLPGGLQINSKMRNQPINEAIGDAKFYASDPLSKDLCYKNPVINSPITLTNDIKQKIWSGYCQAPLPVKEPIASLNELFTKAVSYSQTNKYCLSPITNTIWNSSEIISTLNDVNLDKLSKSIFNIQFSDSRLASIRNNNLVGSKSAFFNETLWMLKSQPNSFGKNAYRIYNVSAGKCIAIGSGFDGEPYIWIDLLNEGNFTFYIKANKDTGGIMLLNVVSNKFLCSKDTTTDTTTEDAPIRGITDVGGTSPRFDIKFNIKSTSQDFYYLMNYPFKIKHKTYNKYICHNPINSTLNSVDVATDNCYFILQPQNDKFKFVFKSSNLAMYVDTDKIIKLINNSDNDKFQTNIMKNGDNNKIFFSFQNMELVMEPAGGITQQPFSGSDSTSSSLSFFFEF